MRRWHVVNVSHLFPPQKIHPEINGAILKKTIFFWGGEVDDGGDC